jgi:hypothetical protein
MKVARKLQILAKAATSLISVQHDSHMNDIRTSFLFDA